MNFCQIDNMHSERGTAVNSTQLIPVIKDTASRIRGHSRQVRAIEQEKVED